MTIVSDKTQMSSGIFPVKILFVHVSSSSQGMANTSINSDSANLLAPGQDI